MSYKNAEAAALFSRSDALRRVARINREECGRYDALAEATRREAARLEDYACELWDKAFALEYPEAVCDQKS